MDRLKNSCEFNMDIACVEMKFEICKWQHDCD